MKTATETFLEAVQAELDAAEANGRRISRQQAVRRVAIEKPAVHDALIREQVDRRDSRVLHKR